MIGTSSAMNKNHIDEVTVKKAQHCLYQDGRLETQGIYFGRGKQKLYYSDLLFLPLLSDQPTCLNTRGSAGRAQLNLQKVPLSLQRDLFRLFETLFCFLTLYS